MAWAQANGNEVSNADLESNFEKYNKNIVEGDDSPPSDNLSHGLQVHLVSLPEEEESCYQISQSKEGHCPQTRNEDDNQCHPVNVGKEHALHNVQDRTATKHHLPRSPVHRTVSQLVRARVRERFGAQCTEDTVQSAQRTLAGDTELHPQLYERESPSF